MGVAPHRCDSCWQLGSLAARLRWRCAAVAASCHRRRNLVPPPLQPRAAAATASCHRRCSLVPPPLQPRATAATASYHCRWRGQAPRCRCLQHHRSLNLISPVTSQPQHSCHCHLTAITASCRPQPHVLPPPCVVDAILARPPLCRTEAAERRSSGLDSIDGQCSRRMVLRSCSGSCARPPEGFRTLSHE